MYTCGDDKKPNDADLALIGSSIALSQQVQRKVPVPDNAMTRYSADVLKESVLSTGDDTVLKTMGKDLKPFGTIDDFYTVQKDLEEYQFPYNHMIAAGDIFLPNLGGFFGGYMALRWELYNPGLATLLGKTATNTAFDKIKEKYLKKLKK